MTLAQVTTLKARRYKSVTQAEAIRALLSDWEPHTTAELFNACVKVSQGDMPPRMSARLFQLHHGEVGPALHYVRLEKGDRITYRRSKASECTVCIEGRVSLARAVEILKRENAALKKLLGRISQN